jgi:hypothetical protein
MRRCELASNEYSNGCHLGIFLDLGHGSKLVKDFSDNFFVVLRLYELPTGCAHVGRVSFPKFHQLPDTN